MHGWFKHHRHSVTLEAPKSHFDKPLPLSTQPRLALVILFVTASREHSLIKR